MMTNSIDKSVKQLEGIDVEHEPVQALDAALVVLAQVDTKSLITEWDSEQSALEYQKYLSNLDKYDGKLITASKAYFNDHLNGKMVNTKIGPVRINSKSRGKIHDRMRDIKYLAIPYIPEVLLTGDVSDLIPLNKDRDDSAVGYYHFSKAKKLNEYTLNITLKVALDNDGNLLYFLGASKEKANLRTVSHAQGTTGSKVGFDSIESQDDDGINLEVQILDKDGNVLSDAEAEELLFATLGIKRSAISAVVKGRTNTVKTAKGTKLQTIFALVETDNVIASHDKNGGVNPKFPQELQPRDRSRDTSQAWVQKTSANLDPDSLGKTGRADTGAPIVGPDLVVESGNGRTMAVQVAYERDTADEYRAWLVEEAEYFGFKAEQVEAFKQPILVRIRTTEIDRAAFAVEANQDDKLSFSATERARSDSKRIDDNMVMLFNPSEDGDLLAASNSKFIQAFLRSLGDTEAAQYNTTDGKPTQALVARIKAAIFSKAYNDDRLLEMVADQAKPDLQNMLNALSVAAPKFIEAQALDRVKAEDLSSQIVDGMEQAIDKRVINAIIDAANVVMTAKNDNQDVAEFVKQQGLFGDLAEGVPELAVFLAKNSRSAKKMSLLFKAMAEYLAKQAFEQSTIGLFGEPEPVKMQDVIQYATGVIEQEYGDKANLSMFDSINSPLLINQLKQFDLEADPVGALDICLQVLTADQVVGEFSDNHSDNYNDENYRYKDVGYIPNSRKELAQSSILQAKKDGSQLCVTDIDWDGLESEPRIAESLITKENVFGKVDWWALKDQGMNGNVAYFLKRLYSAVDKQPTDNTAEARRLYVTGIQNLRTMMEQAKTYDDVRVATIDLSSLLKPIRNIITDESGAKDLSFDCKVMLALGKKLHSWIFKSGNKALHECKRMAVDDWSWLESKVKDESKPKTTRKERFQLEVASDIQRVGGQPVSIESTEQFKDLFGLAAVQSGKWVLNDKESAAWHITNAAASFMDMSDITRIPVEQLGFGGRLGMAFGARGHGGALAHYEPDTRAINITKMRGGGSLGHEYFHFLDNVINEVMGQENVSIGSYGTRKPGALPDGAVRIAFEQLKNAMLDGNNVVVQLYAYGDREIKWAKRNMESSYGSMAHHIKAASTLKDAAQAIDNAYRLSNGSKRPKNADSWVKIAAIYFNQYEGTQALIPTTRRGSDFYIKALDLDQQKVDSYWSSSHEMAARAFSAYLQDRLAEQQRQNDYLAYSTQGGNNRVGEVAYPQGEERQRVNAAFDALFKALRDEDVFGKAMSNQALMDSIFDRSIVLINEDDIEAFYS